MRDRPPPHLSTRRAWGWLAIGAVLTVGMVWTARPAGAGAGFRIAFVLLSLTGAGLLVVGLRAAQPTARQVVVGALVVRALAFPMAPSLSDDGYRYVWDGWVSVEAQRSPYDAVPSDPVFTDWRDREPYRRMNSPDYYSVYPPASQALFAAAAWAGGDTWQRVWWLWKLLVVSVELLGVLVLVRIVGGAGAALYAWHPLAVIEIAGQGHTEGLLIGTFGLILMAGAARVPLASIGATLGGLVKLYPFAVLPAAWRREGWGGVAVSVVLVAGFAAAFWTPEALANAGSSLSLFFGTFDAYAAPYRLLKAALYPILHDSAGRAASLALMGAAGVWIVRGLARDDGTQRGVWRVLAIVVLAVYLAGSTLHPWYAVPLLFFVPLLERPDLTWLLTLSTASYVGYEIAGADVVTLLVGWGGAAWIYARSRRRPGADRVQHR